MCQIKIGDFEEYFDLYPNWWRVEDYQRQWQEGLRRLEDHDRSCFVVAVDDPACRRFVAWWPLYKVGNKVYVQNHIIIEDIYDEVIGDKPFTVETCYDFIPERGEPCDEDGNKISEWVVDWKQSIKYCWRIIKYDPRSCDFLNR